MRVVNQRARTGMLIGVDFGAPRRDREQRRKIVAVAARCSGPRRYVIEAGGLNARLVALDPPGWSAAELLKELLARPARAVGFDFPFSVPTSLLDSASFAAAAGHHEGSFRSWRAFSAFIARELPLTDPLVLEPFNAWRDPAQRARLWKRRDTDIAAGAQPPLKDRFQATFQMTLVGNALLARLWESGAYRVLPFPDGPPVDGRATSGQPAGGHGPGEVIEVYPRATLRYMGLSSYKDQPAEAVRAGIAACTAAGILVDVHPQVVSACVGYSSSTSAPDHDAADALVALCTTILFVEGCCRPATQSKSHAPCEREGAIWVPMQRALADSSADRLR